MLPSFLLPVGIARRLYFAAEDIPDVEGRVAGGDVDVLFRYGMHEFHMPCMQADATVGIGARCAVFEVSAYGESDGRQLAAYLVVSSGVQVDFKHLQPFGHGDASDVENGGFCPWCFSTEGISPVLPFVAGEIVFQRDAFVESLPLGHSFCGVFGFAGHDGMVGFVHFTLLEHFVHP